jgi:hypothetical protein
MAINFFFFKKMTFFLKKKQQSKFLEFFVIIQMEIYNLNQLEEYKPIKGCFISITNNKTRVYIDKFFYYVANDIDLNLQTKGAKIIKQNGLVTLVHVPGRKFIIPRIKMKYNRNFNQFFRKGKVREYGISLSVNRNDNIKAECVVKVAKFGSSDTIYFLYASDDQFGPIDLTWKHIKESLSMDRVKKTATYSVKSHD